MTLSVSPRRSMLCVFVLGALVEGAATPRACRLPPAKGLIRNCLNLSST